MDFDFFRNIGSAGPKRRQNSDRFISMEPDRQVRYRPMDIDRNRKNERFYPIGVDKNRKNERFYPIENQFPGKRQVQYLENERFYPIENQFPRKRQIQYRGNVKTNIPKKKRVDNGNVVKNKKKVTCPITKYDFVSGNKGDIVLKTDVEIRGAEDENICRVSVKNRNDYVKDIRAKFTAELESKKHMMPNNKDEDTLASMIFSQRMLIENPSMAFFVIGNIGQGKTAFTKWMIELFYATYRDKVEFVVLSNSGGFFYKDINSKPLIKHKFKLQKYKNGKVKKVMDPKQTKNRLIHFWYKLIGEQEKKSKDSSFEIPKRVLILDDVFSAIKKDTKPLGSLVALFEIIRNRYHWNLNIFVTNHNFTGTSNELKSLFDFVIFVSKTDNSYGLRQLNTFLEDDEKLFAKEIFNKMALNNYMLAFKRDISTRGGFYANCDREYMEKKTLWWNKSRLFAAMKDFVPLNINKGDIDVPYISFFYSKLSELKERFPKQFKLQYSESTKQYS